MREEWLIGWAGSVSMPWRKGSRPVPRAGSPRKKVARGHNTPTPGPAGAWANSTLQKPTETDPKPTKNDPFLTPSPDPLSRRRDTHTLLRPRHNRAHPRPDDPANIFASPHRKYSRFP